MLLTAILLASLLIDAKPQAVEVVRTPAVAQRVMFDPKNPAPSIPKLNEGESAITVSKFELKAELTQDGVVATLSLENRIYLPSNARATLRAHEEAHRVINERIYEQEAERIVRQIVQRIVHETWSSLDRAADEIRTSYRSEIATRAAQVNDRFDEITAHGANEDITVIDAIEQAFRDYASK